MFFRSITNNIFNQLEYLLRQLTDAAYAQPFAEMNGATLGQHARHVLEFYQCLQAGYQGGIVNYDKRARDHRIESDRTYALALMARLEEALNGIDDNPTLVLEYLVGKQSVMTFEVRTSYQREIVYLAEHAVHHLALMAVIVRMHYRHITLPDHFGVADATVRYKAAHPA
jgi:hypothetical protein